MGQRTMQFNMAIKEIVDTLVPHKHMCKNCGAEFDVAMEDIQVYKKFRVPPPTLCFLCRMQRRMAFYLRFPPFYRKKCSAPGHSERVITLFPNSSPHIVYDNAYWRSDDWDALEYGASFDFARPFFEQFRDLYFRIPHQALFVDPQSVNSEYAIGGIAARNCYYVGSPVRSENILYSWGPFDSRDSVDVVRVNRSELLYECVRCDNCFNCNFSMDSENCRDSWFLYDCKNCSNCFMSANLRTKSYCFRGEQLSKEEYEKKMRSLDLEKRAVLDSLREDFKALQKNATHRHVYNKNATDSVGDELSDCKRCFYTFDVNENSEDLRYVQYGIAVKDLMDVSGIDRSSVGYESLGIGGGGNIFFSSNLRNCSFMEYSAYCRDSNYCFGCVGLRNKKFCVLNKQFVEEDYWKIVDEIKTAMLGKREYGEFFSLKLGLAPYQNTIAQREFPLSKEEAEKRGIPWYKDRESDFPSSISVLKPEEVPQTIVEVSDGILEKAIECEVSGKLFRIIKSELEFYRKKNFPLPVKHPDVRLKEKFDMMNRLRIYWYPCTKCGRQMFTSYDPKNKFRVYCEECYQNEIA